MVSRHRIVNLRIKNNYLKRLFMHRSSLWFRFIISTTGILSLSLSLTLSLFLSVSLSFCHNQVSYNSHFAHVFITGLRHCTVFTDFTVSLHSIVILITNASRWGVCICIYFFRTSPRALLSFTLSPSYQISTNQLTVCERARTYTCTCTRTLPHTHSHPHKVHTPFHLYSH